MVQDISRSDVLSVAPTANPVFYRTYSRRVDGERESWQEVCKRTLDGLAKLGELTIEEIELISRMQHEFKALPSGRWLWVGGTEWIEKPEQFYGGYNCSSINVVDWQSFGLMMNLAMQGSGTGAVLEEKYINQLPVIRNRLHVTINGEIGATPPELRFDETRFHINEDGYWILVGDSRQGWVKAYQALLELSTDERFDGEINVVVDISDVRPCGEKLKSFGGTANPVGLPTLFGKVANVLNKAIGRKLTSVECCLIINEAASCVVAGSIRRSANIQQASSNDEAFAVAKDNLWQQDESGNWRIDPERDVLRMANHTRVFHHKPSLEECIAAVTKQYYSGEGAIQWAGEAVARANADLLDTPQRKRIFLRDYTTSTDDARHFLKTIAWDLEPSLDLSDEELDHRMQRYGLNPLTLAA